MTRLLRVWITLLVLGASVALADDEDFEARIENGVETYFAGRFSAAVVDLKAGLGGIGTEAPAELRARTAFFAGRALRELGLRGLALHYLGQAERAGKDGTGPWRVLAQREMVRAYFEAAEYSAVSQLYWRIDPTSQTGEAAYLAGMALAMEGRWKESVKVLSELPPSDPLVPFAEFTRAQARAADGDLADAATRLARLEKKPDLPEGLADQARILRGKILYLLDRKKEGQQAFAAVTGSGEAGLEAVRGLLLTGAGTSAASRVQFSESRPSALASGMLVRARAADESGEVEIARDVRERLRSLVNDRRASLDGLLSGGNGTSVLRADLATFAGRLRQERWKVKAEQERSGLDSKRSASIVLSNPEPFAPRDETFYEIWNRARSDQWLRGLIEVQSRIEEIDQEIAGGPGRVPLWSFWKGEDDGRFGLALLALRVANLRQALDDHRHTFERQTKEETAARKTKALEEAVDAVRRLYLGDAKIPQDSLENLRLRLEYKRGDIMRLTAAVPERSTSPASSLFGNYIDLLAEMRVALEELDIEVPKLDAERDRFVADVTNRSRGLRGEIRGEIDQAMAPELRRQMAFFIRLDADNEGALSRSYARGSAEKDRGARP